MQKLYACRLERHDEEWPEARQSDGAALCVEIEKWLYEGKGAERGVDSGRYEAEDHSDARFEIKKAVDKDRS